MKLNSEQKKAVLHTKGPLLLVAGAGTGKTTVITQKILHLIKKKLALPSEILALTFTERAAAEMEERVDQAMPYGYFQMHISTFHAFADKILRNEASHIGLNPGYILMTTAENIIFLRNHLFAFNLKYFRPLGNPTKFLEDLLKHFSRLRDEDISPIQYLAFAKKMQKKKGIEKEEKEKVMELAKAYEQYERLKVKEGYLDFSDLIYYLVRLFRERTNILARYQKQFRHILVDEFQDTNIAQYILLKQLAPPANKPNLTVVGDDSQAIYKFRGASVSNILAFMKDYKGAKQITLRKNYRSLQPILDASYKLIKHNDPDTLEAQLGISKNLVAQRMVGDKTQTEIVTFHLFESADREADFIAKEIIEVAKTTPLSQIAILARANSHLTALTRTLNQHGILYQFHGPTLLFKQEDVRDLIAYLNVLVDLEDSISLYRVLGMEIFDLSDRDIALLVGMSRRLNSSLFEVMEVAAGTIDKDLQKENFNVYIKYLPKLSKPTREKLLTIYTMIHRHLKMRRRETAGQILYYFLEDTGYLPLLARHTNPREERRTLTLSRFFARLKSYEAEHDDASVYAVADFIKMNEELGESPILGETDRVPYEAVHLLTVHGAKGLEFSHVFAVNLVAGRFPTIERSERIPIPDELIKETLPVGDYHLEEERRLFYVASTRAANRLYLTASAFYGDGKRQRKISPFVSETLGEVYVSNVQAIKQEEKDQMSIFEYKKRPERVVRSVTPLTTFSYTQLETFLTCPLQYKLRYILRLPAPQTAAESLGVSIHSALEEFYHEVKVEKKPGLPRLLELYRAHWIPIGYSSLAHQIKMKTEGEKMLKKYFEKFHNSKIDIIDLERPFKIRVFDFTIVGKMDRVDRKSDGSIEIVDYKTGRMPEARKLEKSLQAAIYFLAALDKGLYGKRASEVKLTFIFLQNGEQYTVTKKQEDVPQIKEDLKKIVEAIRTSKFPSKKGPWCDFCPYRDICCYRAD